MDPTTLAALMQMMGGMGGGQGGGAGQMQMLMNSGQGAGAGLAQGGAGGWGNVLNSSAGPLGAINPMLGFGASLAGGYLTGRSAKKAKKKAQKRFTKALNASESIQGHGLQQQEALARQATSQTLGGYDAAKREASRLGRGAKQDALDRGAQLEASASQNLTDRGLGSTTRGGNISRGIQADVSRERGRVNEDLAGVFGNLAMGRAGAEAQGTRDIAGISGQQSHLMDQVQQMRQLGGATLGSLGSFDPGSWTQGYQPDTQGGMMEGLGAMMGGGGGQGAMNPQLMQMLQQLFSQGGMSGG